MGVEALTKLEQQDVDLVLLDLAMPNTDGATLLKQLRQITPEVPVVLVSSSDHDVLERNLVTGERPNILHRPFRPEELLTVVDHAMPVRASVSRDD
jgi:CheY-like chemotaxis protein